MALKASELPKIIGLVGRRRSGKDAAADYLTTAYGYTKRKFAAPLKSAIGALFDFSEEQLEGELKDVVDPRWGASPRRLMQYFGTDVMQHNMQLVLPSIGRGFAVKRMFIGEGSGGGQGMVAISDVRFVHEAVAIRERGGVLLKLIRNNVVGGWDGIDAHTSETELEGIICDKIIENNGDLEGLYRGINGALKELRRPWE